MQLEVGQIIDGRFEVEAMVGEGGLAEVYRVRHRELGRVMALKLLTWRKKSLIERLVLEGRIQAQLNHPNVVAVLDLVRHNGQVGLLMEYIDAETLGEYIARVGPTAEDEALELLAPILAAVDSAHAAGITHRDLKPANIMLAVVGTALVPKVADFGIAKVVHDATSDGAHQTRSGATMGTPGYLAPEQVHDASTIDGRADVFALGAIAYELLCGNQAFADEAGFVAVTATATMEPLPLQGRCNGTGCDITESVAKAVHRALAKDLDERYPTVRAFAEGVLASRLDLLDRFRANDTSRIQLSISPTDDTSRIPVRTTTSTIEPLPTTAATHTSVPAGIGLVAVGVVGTIGLLGVLLMGALGGAFFFSQAPSAPQQTVVSPAAPDPVPVVDAASAAEVPTNDMAPIDEPTAALPPPVGVPLDVPPTPAADRKEVVVEKPVVDELGLPDEEEPVEVPDAVAVVELPQEVTVTKVAAPPPKPTAPVLTGDWSGKAGSQRMSLKLVSAGNDLTGSLVLYVGTQVRTEPLRGTVSADGSVRFSAGDLAFVGTGGASSLSGTYMREGAKKSVDWSASK